MTKEQKIEYMQIACNICGLQSNTQGVDLLVSIYEFVLQNEGDATIKQIESIKAEVKHRADVKSRTEMLDKVSEKI